MKHCHFTILYNELPFLKQKLPFLYKHFDQLVFFDLNVGSYSPHFSTDGSHEFILDFPDPECKITLIEKTDISDVHNYCGDGSVGKQKMFAVGSSYVRDDMDVFWCTDMDEFFYESFIGKVENILYEFPDVNSIDLQHLCFWKNFSYILCTPESDTMTLWPRVARHQPGNLYSHCAINKQFPQTHFLDPSDESYYHFGWIGDRRVRRKLKHYTEPPTGSPNNAEMYRHYLTHVWEKFNDISNTVTDEMFGYPYMHPNFLGLKMGIKKIDDAILPKYINYEDLLRDLGESG